MPPIEANEKPAVRYGPSESARQIRIASDDGCVRHVRLLREPQLATVRRFEPHRAALDGLIQKVE